MTKKIPKKALALISFAALIIIAVLISLKLFIKPNKETGGEPTYFSIRKSGSYVVNLADERLVLKTECDQKNPEILWSSSNDSKASVDNGVVTLHKEGIIIISAEIPGTELSDKAIVKIISNKTVPATGVEIVNKPDRSISFDERTIYLTHNLQPDNSEFEEVVFSSSDKTIATVTNSGRVTILSPGEVKIRVALKNNPDIYDECTLNILWDRIESVGGSFEGESGYISLYSPSAITSNKHEYYEWQNPLTVKRVKKADKTYKLLVEGNKDGWDTLFVRLDKAIEKGKQYVISFEADWLSGNEPKEYGYAIIPDTGNWLTDESDNIRNFSNDVKWYNGKVKIPFTATQNIDSFYLVLVNQDGSVKTKVELDNIQLISADSVVLDTAIYNDDGTFEGKSGKYSLISAHALADGAEGKGWSANVNFEKVSNNNGNAIKVTSSGEHNIDYLYIKVDIPLKKNYKYNITMDLKALDKQCKNGTYGYWVLTDKADVNDYIQYFREVNSEELFKESASFDIISDGDHSSFYLLLREYTPEDSGRTDSKFNFIIDNIKLETVEYMGNTLYIDTNGELDGNGNISFYSPTESDEVKGKEYAFYNSILFKKIGDENGNGILSVKSSGTSWDTLFIKFKTPLMRGSTYELSFDADWKGSLEPKSYGYSIMPNTSNWVTDNSDNLVNYSSDVKWFDGEVKISFTANDNLEEWYLVLVIQDADVTLDMTFDNIGVKEVLNSIKNDDGTFEGKLGIYSLMTPHQIDGAEGNGWSTKLFFERKENTDGHAIKVTSSGEHAIDYLYIRVNSKLRRNYKYNFSMDISALDEQCKNGTYGYWVLSPDATVDKCVQFYKSIESNNLFGKNTTLEFVSNGEYDYFYIVLREFTDESSGIADSKFNFLIDNLKLEEIEHMGDSEILNDDGTFENKSGGISLYSPLNENVTSATYGAFNPILFKKLKIDDNTVIEAKSTGTGWDAVFIKFNEQIKKGKQYTVSYSAKWNGKKIPQVYGYSVMPKSTNWLVENENMANFNGSVKWFDGEVVITFTANADLESWYLVLADQDIDVPLDMTIDNIKLTVDETKPAIFDSFKDDDGTFEGNSGPISLYSPLNADVTSVTYSAFNPISFTTVKKAKGNALSVKSTGTGWDAIFIKFAIPLVKGKKYTVTYDANWKGEKMPTVYGYSIMPTNTNWLADGSNMADFDGSVRWFDGKVTISFTANANLNSWYMVLADQNGDVPIDMEIDNISVSD